MMDRKGGSQLEMFNDELLNEAFRIFDKDGNGLITEMEIRSVMSNLGSRTLFFNFISKKINSFEIQAKN